MKKPTQKNNIEKEIVRNMFKAYLENNPKSGDYQNLVNEYCEHIKFLLTDEADY